jgi:molecular chaperone HscB
MNYFELFEIPVQLQVDKSVLPRKYFELSRRYHPDFFVNGTPEEQALALDRSALLNKAFQTFQHPDETIRYVLSLKGLLEDEEKYTLPPEFLMEVMEINESMMDFEGENSGITASIARLETEIYTPVKAIIEQYQDETATEADLLAVKEYYFKKKYIDRIRTQQNNTSGKI